MVTSNPTKARASSETAAPQFVDVPLDKLDPSPHNARDDAADHAAELAHSLTDVGVLQPVLCRPKDNGRYELVAGERRYHAARAAKLRTLPAIVRPLSDAEALVAGMAENLARRNLNPMQRAAGLSRLVAPVDEGGAGMKVAAAARLFGKKSCWVSNHVRLLRLPAEWRDRIAAGEITERMGRTLVPYVDKPEVLAAIERDRAANPWAYRTSDDFDRQVKRIADGEVHVPPATTAAKAAAKIKPPRAAPSTLSRETHAPRPASRAPIDDDDDDDRAVMETREGGLSQADLDGDHDADWCCTLIERLPTIEHLEQVEAACVARRAALMKAARSKRN